MIVMMPPWRMARRIPGKAWYAWSHRPFSAPVPPMAGDPAPRGGGSFAIDTPIVV
jgi:hypothetical protein